MYTVLAVKFNWSCNEAKRVWIILALYFTIYLEYLMILWIAATLPEMLLSSVGTWVIVPLAAFSHPSVHKSGLVFMVSASHVHAFCIIWKLILPYFDFDTHFFQEEETPYSFFVNEKEVTKELSGVMDSTTSEEKVMTILYQPQAVFRVQPVARQE